MKRGSFTVRQIVSSKLEEGKNFKKEYILGRGYPLFSIPIYRTEYYGYLSVSLHKHRIMGSLVQLKIPPELEYHTVPKYELILREIK